MFFVNTTEKPDVGLSENIVVIALHPQSIRQKLLVRLKYVLLDRISENGRGEQSLIENRIKLSLVMMREVQVNSSIPDFEAIGRRSRHGTFE